MQFRLTGPLVALFVSAASAASLAQADARANSPSAEAILNDLKSPEPAIDTHHEGQVTLDPARIRVEARDTDSNLLEVYVDDRLIRSFSGPYLRGMAVMLETRDYYRALLSEMANKGRKVTLDLDHPGALYYKKDGKSVIVPSDEELYPHSAVMERLRLLAEENVRLKAQLESRRTRH